MFKVFIADDEIYVLSLIERLIDWPGMNLEIVGTADNGYTAYEEITRLSPDIVIVDVRMPGCDGISLMQKVRASDEHVRFIMISGHKRFEYAKSAMKYNVEDYILKPINKSELESILHKITQKLAREREAQKTREAPDAAANANLNKLFLERYLAEGIAPEDLAIDRVREKYLLNLEEGAFRFVIVQLNSLEKELDSAFVETTISLIERHFFEEIHGLCGAFAAHHTGRAVTFFLNYPEEDEEMLLARFELFHERIRGILTKFEALSTNVCLGRRVARLAQIGESLADARLAQRSRIALGLDRIIDSRTVRRNPQAQLEAFSERRAQALQAAIRNLDIAKIRSQLTDIFAQAEDLRYVDNCIAYDAADFVLMQFHQYIRQIDLIKEDFAEFQAGYAERLDACTTSAEMSSAIADEIAESIRRFFGEKQTNEHPAIRIAKRYIAENYQSAISLSVLANIVNMSPIYFSTMFKRELQINFLDYLNQYRIGKSKELLRDVRLNVNEVAAASGFPDPRYFAKVFRKIMGVTPTEYRNYHAN